MPEVHAGAGQVRIRVHAATVNPTDVGVRNGTRAEQQKTDPPPYVPRMDVAGMVDEVGSGVPDRLKVGDAVMAIVVPKGSHGAYREQIVLDARSVVRVPAEKTHPEAATFPMNGLTARLSLDLLKLSPGQVIAVTGAAGAYGGYVIQLAKAEGLTVIADASENDEKLVASLGADIVVRRGDDVASRIRSHFAQGVDGLADGAVLNELVIPASAAPSRPSGGSRAFRRGISTLRQPLCAPARRSGRSSIGSGNWWRSAKSRFAWQRSIRGEEPPMPIVSWRLAVQEDGWSSNSSQERQAGEPSAHAHGAFEVDGRVGWMTRIGEGLEGFFGRLLGRHGGLYAASISGSIFISGKRESP
jgi:NADPH:quinone reductase-like Zn-dependent oxidoreductase